MGESGTTDPNRTFIKMAQNFVKERSEEERLAESGKMMSKYPDRIPVVIFSTLDDISGKYKFLFPVDFTMGQALTLYRRRVKVQPHEALFLFVGVDPEIPFHGGVLPPSTSLMSHVHSQYKHTDGFLYLVIRQENTFGCDFQARAEQILKHLYMTPAEIAALEQVDQRTPQWFEGRKPTVPGLTPESPPLKLARITASVCGCCIGMNRFKTKNQFLTELIYGAPSFHSPACDWGTKLEPVAESVYQGVHPDYKISHPGLRVCEKMPWIGGSPDGLIETPSEGTGILEIKCPYSKKLYEKVPDQYYAQVQLCMYLFHCDWSDFVVMTPTLTGVERIPYSAEFVDRLLAGIHEFYFGSYLPLLLRKEQGLLSPGSIAPQMDIQLDIPLELNGSDSDSDSGSVDSQ